MSRLRAACGLLLCSALLACGQPAATDALRPASPPAVGSSTTSCPRGDERSDVVVDRVPFLRYDGRQYVATGQSVPARLVGRELGSVTCRLGDAPHDPDRAPQDGDAAFLAPGTGVHELQGAPAEVRLLAQDEGTWRLYEVDDDPAAQQAQDLLDLRDVVRVSLVEAERGEDVVRAVSDPVQVAELVAAVRQAPLLPISRQADAVRGPQWFVRFDLADGPPVQRAWYPEGRWLFPRIAAPEALHEALLD